MAKTVSVRRCDCGAVPKLRCEQVAEDCEETWVECPSCGAASERFEDAYCDYGMAAHIWNLRNMQARP